MIRNAVIAAIVGATCGATAGLWSIHSWPPQVTAVVPAPREHAVSSSPAQPASLAHDAPAQTPPSTRAMPPEPSQPALTAGDGRNVLERTRALAHRPDVRALLEVRESIARRAAERGETQSPAFKAQLAEVDRHLAEARTLQLKLDRQALRASTAATSTLP